ncbi:MAG: hypothetical protein ACR2KU_06685 [Gammaproteobacteria bacterium]|nr:hypothetical protein [Gammaproteobacteria bacterium]MBA3731269.1 hypothetical protein [Gammaproteobacteria bacterium]
MASSTTHNNRIQSARIKGPTAEFAVFCDSERAHRRNTDPNFDPALYDEAVALVLDRLAATTRDTPQ